MYRQTQSVTGARGQTNPRIGYVYAALNAVISGFAIYINSLGVKLFSDSTVYTTLKNAVVGVALVLPFLLLRGRRDELRRLSGRQWGYLLLLALVGGSLSYALFFRGLQLTTPVTGALINHAQFLLVAALAVFILGERIGPLMWLALMTLLIGTTLGTNLQAVRWDQGAALVLISTVLFAGGVVLAKHLLSELSTLTVMAAKMSLGSVMLVGYLAATGRLQMIAHLSLVQWRFVLLTGVMLLAFTVTAFLALRHASATATTAIPAASPVITTGLVAAASPGYHLAPVDGLGLLLMVVAAAVIFIAGQRIERRNARGQAEGAAI